MTASQSGTVFVDRLRDLLQPTDESGREPIGGVARVLVWRNDSAAVQQAIDDAIVTALADLARHPSTFVDKDTSRLLLQLAQLVAEARLDDRARALLWSIAQYGRVADVVPALLPPEIEAKVLAWLSVIQIPEWIPMWKKLWKSAHRDLWGVAFGGMISGDPGTAWMHLPELLDRREALGDATRAQLLYRLLQHSEALQDAARAWSRSASSMADEAQSILLTEYREKELSPRVVRGLAVLRGSSEHAPAWSTYRLETVVALIDAAAAAEQSKRLPDAERLLNRALEVASDGPRDVVLRVLNRLGLVAQKQKRLRDAESHFRKAVELAEEVGGEERLASLLLLLAQVLSAERDYSESEAAFRRAIKFYQQLQLADMESLAWSGLASNETWKGSREVALSLWQHALNLAIESDAADAIAVASAGLDVLTKGERRQTVARMLHETSVRAATAEPAA